MSNPISNDIDSHIGKKYEIRRRLGKGAYGVVWKAIDREEANRVNPLNC
jgi:mitogen-activated protein kinase 15